MYITIINWISLRDVHFWTSQNHTKSTSTFWGNPSFPFPCARSCMTTLTIRADLLLCWQKMCGPSSRSMPMRWTMPWTTAGISVSCRETYREEPGWCSHDISGLEFSYSLLSPTENTENETIYGLWPPAGLWASCWTLRDGDGDWCCVLHAALQDEKSTQVVHRPCIHAIAATARGIYSMLETTITSSGT